MAILTIHSFPDPILKKVATPVTNFNQKLIETTESMLETMYVSKGIGLAANQVGILQQIVVMDLNSGEEDSSLREPKVFINPRIIEKSGTTVSEEGCLSVFDYRADVERAENITLKYQDVKGKPQSLEANDLTSICLQHELDHLKGVIFLDHLPLLKQKMIKKKLTKFAQNPE